MMIIHCRTAQSCINGCFACLALLRDSNERVVIYMAEKSLVDDHIRHKAIALHRIYSRKNYQSGFVENSSDTFVSLDLC